MEYCPVVNNVMISIQLRETDVLNFVLLRPITVASIMVRCLIILSVTTVIRLIWLLSSYTKYLPKIQSN